MVYTSVHQLAAIVPYGLVGASSAQVVIEYNGVKLAPVTVPVAAAVPGLFSANQTGTGQGAIQNADGSYNNASNPAARGSIVVLYGTGQGQTNPPASMGGSRPPYNPVPPFRRAISRLRLAHRGGPGGYPLQGTDPRHRRRLLANQRSPACHAGRGHTRREGDSGRPFEPGQSHTGCEIALPESYGACAGRREECDRLIQVSAENRLRSAAWQPQSPTAN